MPMDRKRLVETIAYALWQRMDLRPKKRSLNDARIWAGQVVEHMDLCGIECHQRPPKPPHSSPAIQKDRDE
jgi:hypothetical protein